MRWIHHFTLMAVITNCWGKAENTNDISAKQPEIKLDLNLRKALLRALNDLESEEKFKLETRLKSNSNKVGSFSDSLANGVFEKAPASTISIITQTSSSVKPTTTQKITTTENSTIKPIVVVQKSTGIQHRPITSFIPTSKPEFDPIYDSEHIIASASSSFTGSPKFQSFKNDGPQTRSVPEKKVNPNLVSITNKPRHILPHVDITTATPIITSSTEESEAKVEDVQFFAAPLVAAFTVHHDEQGLPKSVEPLFKAPGQNAVSTTDIEEQRLKQGEAQRLKQQEAKYREEQLKLQQYLRQQEQVRLQFDLEEKQRILEQQIRSLQQQQQHQDYLLRQQQLFQEQNLLQQRQKLLEEQKTLLNKNQQTTSRPPFSPHSIPTINSNQNRFTNQFNNNLNHQAKGVTKSIASGVSFQPSITFQPAPQIDNALILPVEQQLPVKNAGDFRQTLFQRLPLKTAEDFLQQPQYPPLSDEPFLKFNSRQPQLPPVREFQNFNFRQNVPVPPRSNRVFRQEFGTGNFVNNEFNSPNNFFNSNQPQSNRFFRSNSDTFSVIPSISQDFHNARQVRPPVVNNQLNNLLYYSGIARGNQHEDLNIVSKVLSLNHLGADNFFGSSEVLEQRLMPPQKDVFVKS